MIIRMTVNDNDFFNELLDFVDMFPTRHRDSFIITHKLQRFMDNIDTKDLEEEDKKYICKTITEKWNDYVDELDCHKVTKQFLIKSFRVSIKKSFIEMDENYEAFYYFSRAKKYLYQ